MACCARATAKVAVAAFSLLVLALGTAVLTAGVFSSSYINATWLADAMPKHASYILVAVGVLMLFVAVTGFFGIICCLHKSKLVLAILALATVALTVLASATSAVAFNYHSIAKSAAASGFANASSEAEASVYRSLRNSFVRAYTQCNATSYFTANVRGACKLQDALPGNTLDVSECAKDGYGGSEDALGRAAIYCRSGPALMREPFTVDSALAFPSEWSVTELPDFTKMHTFGYFLDAVCVPNATRYYEMIAELVALHVPGVLVPPSVAAAARASTFGKCYTSSWWDEKTSDGLDAAEQAALAASPSIPGGFMHAPNGSALSAEQRAFFNGLQASRAAFLGNPYLSAKLSFCFCADAGAESRLFYLLTNALAHIEWVSLTLAIVFGLTLLAEIYLGCCVKDASASQGNVVVRINGQPVRMNGWAAGTQTGLIGQ